MVSGRAGLGVLLQKLARNVWKIPWSISGEIHSPEHVPVLQAIKKKNHPTLLHPQGMFQAGVPLNFPVSSELFKGCTCRVAAFTHLRDANYHMQMTATCNTSYSGKHSKCVVLLHSRSMLIADRSLRTRAWFIIFYTYIYKIWCVNASTCCMLMKVRVLYKKVSCQDCCSLELGKQTSL